MNRAPARGVLAGTTSLRALAIGLFWGGIGPPFPEPRGTGPAIRACPC